MRRMEGYERPVSIGETHMEAGMNVRVRAI